jgi:hypothetical protein
MGGDRASAFVRLYMLPGVQHCADGPGAGGFDERATDPRRDMFLALQSWVEDKAAPAALIGTKYEESEGPPGPPKASAKVVLTRPLCPYPQVAKYRGTGDTRDAASFACALP